MATTSQIEAPSTPFLDRDLSWLEFNRRVLHEALDTRTPLLERVKFLAIFSNNLDEFFMKRADLLKRRVVAAADGTAPESAAQKRQARVRQTIQGLLRAQAEAFTGTIRPELARNGIHLLDWPELTEFQRGVAVDYFRRNLFPVLTPLAVDPGHPFPFISNLSTSLGILLRTPDANEVFFARVKVPDTMPQWLSLPDDRDNGQPGRRHCFVRLLDLIRWNLSDLFPGMTVVEVMPFRVTRNAAVEPDEEKPENLALMVEEELWERRFQKAVRLEYAAGGSATQLQLLQRKLELHEADLYEMTAELDFTDLFPIAGLNLPELHDKPWQPLVPLALADEDSDIFALMRSGDFLVHHPYESFEATVARFIRQAVEDPKVLALKMTVYRVGSNTPFLDALIDAAEAGKQVACLVELTAQFDERSNLQLAQALEKAGVHVVYGVVGLKTHCKTTLVVRQDADGLRCYAHIGTGNYHVKTAGLYTDLGLFTCDPVLTGDVVNLFHYLTGRSLKRDYARLLVAPVNMRSHFLERIDREIEHQRAGRPAHIIAKMNQLEDHAICEALVRASRAGVEIDLIVRGLCILPPGVPGTTERVRTISVIGRFLEHSRIYYFRNGEEDPLAGSFYIGSADWMERNLSRRVEAIAPIEARPLRERLWRILQVMLHDRRQAWDMQPDGSYVQRLAAADGKEKSEALGTHQTLMNEILAGPEAVPETPLPAESGGFPGSGRRVNVSGPGEAPRP
jgi:polyphosphate kinase